MERRSIGDVTMPYTKPFRFCALPTEVRFNVLENTDLVTPVRRVLWNPKTKYKLPPRTMKGSWNPPSALFPVSKAFCAQAQEVFFKHNQVVVWHHLGSFVVNIKHDGPTNMPVDYAATEYFTKVLAPGSFRYLRHLEIPTLPMICKGGREMANQARSNWFQTLRYVMSEGGLDNLRFLRISGLWHDAPIRDSFQYPVTTTAQEENLMILRNFVKDRIWPMIHPECGSPLLPRQLLVEIHGHGHNDSQYSIRKKGEQLPNKNNGEIFDRPIASRLISWQSQRHGETMGEWMDDAQNGEWIEEAWVMGDDHEYRKPI
ncbi:hypothetical protein HD806DRAFT_475081 [Xylariaceae sp. AK1471]|nr:hypothetical protein HD806DRAFT_475081 [Xylariaceae sp. AK1471]